LIYKLGQKYKIVRILYYKLTGRSLWGIMGLISAFGCNSKYPENYEEFKEYIEKVFRTG